MIDEPTLVFVHLNSQIPLYLKLNLDATSELFPNHKIVLVHNQVNLRFKHPHVSTYIYKGSTDATNIEANLKHPRGFRKNFWFTSIARFDALREYMEIYRESILHVESDILLSKDFPVSKFCNFKYELAYPVVALNRGVASTVYIANSKSASRFVKYATESCLRNPLATDMEILANFALQNESYVHQLAFSPLGKSSFHALNFPPGLSALSQSLEYFGGIFDGNDLGVYLFGFDPRNTKAISYIGTSIPGNYANIQEWKMKYDDSRLFVSVLDSGILIPVFSLHATSKNPLLFWKITRGRMIRRGIRLQHKNPRRKLNLIVLIMMSFRKLLKTLKF